MKRKTVVAIVGLALLCLASLPAYHGHAAGEKGTKTDAAAVMKELARLQGTWTFVSREAGGKQVMGEDKNFFLVIRGDVGVLKIGKSIGQVCKIKIVDATSDPKKLDLIMTDGTNEGEVVYSIYQIEGDLFKYCGSINNPTGRPTAFATKEGDETTYCNSYRRAK
jgi:uncharacterized protein (TIGR03067 family)